ncbi:sulfatase-like hydrolase/transferase [Halosquirtibacter xylanolyticus]|uniref:sulfatase-like hydrolase/transferase n=1 Tax=Halosquirtibacter xylanolyticus TaxID=3374599 RepID=UPI0037485185|nr:sulfatase-like hydrolase/transferase [Prolixibacteraceae bacterium]
MNKLKSTLVLSFFGIGTVFAQERPNIIVFLVDDLGWNDTSLAMSGEPTEYNKRYKTPNLEKLADKGMILTNAHAQPLCVPSRASLLSGQNFINHNVIGDYDCTFTKKKDILIPPGDIFNPRYALPQIVREAGYRTIHVGKYHLSEHVSKFPTPETSGFDVNIAGSNFGAPGSYYAKDNYSRGKNIMHDLEGYAKKGMHLTDALTDTAKAEISKSVAMKKPFFMYLAHYAIHRPLQKHAPYDREYHLQKGEDIGESYYASLIEGVDHSLGSVMDHLKKLKIDDNTIIIFFGDNGGLVMYRKKRCLYGGHQFNYPLRSGKASLYEGGIRVPAVVSWPSKRTSSGISNAPVMIEDIYPTVLAAAGAKVPKEYSVDGMDLSHLVKTGKAKRQRKHRSMCFHFPYRFVGTVMCGKDFTIEEVNIGAAIIKDGWKLIYHQYDEHFALYNLNEDIGEEHNIIDSHMGRALDLAKILESKFSQYKPTVAVRVDEQRRVSSPMEAFTKNYNL